MLSGEKSNRANRFFKIAQCLEKLGEISRAILYLVKASEIDKEDTQIKLHLAKNYLTLDKPMLAEHHLKGVLKNDPGNERARELLKHCA